jgi:hypothetical protein
MYPTEEYQKAFEMIESSIMSCDKLEQIEVVNRLISAFEKDSALPVHVEYLEGLVISQIYLISTSRKKVKKSKKQEL